MATCKRIRADLNCKRGVTVLEMVVVIGILGILVALLLPAVQDSRETARQTLCRNHLRQLGLAMANVVDSTGAYPTTEAPVSGYWKMLPFLDAGAISESMEAGHAPDSFHVSVMACPDDPVVEENMRGGDTNYYVNDGTHFRRFLPLNGFRKGYGGRENMDTRPRDVSDGLSQTVAMSERLVHPIRRPAREVMEQETRRYFWWTETRYHGQGEEPLAVDQCQNHRTTVLPQTFGVNAPNYHMGTSGYDHILPPNHVACYNGPEDFQIDSDAFLIPASSLHPAGVHSLLGDGSVHFVSEQIDVTVWQALGTRDGHEAFANPFGP